MTTVTSSERGALSPSELPGTHRRTLVRWLLTTTALASASGLFAFAHWQYWRRTGDPKGISFALEEMIVVFVAIARRPPTNVSRSFSDWIFALLGSYGVLLLRPGGEAVLHMSTLWVAVQIVGALCAMICSVRLGRSFGVVPADRGVQLTGPYRLVRHPLYASYTVLTIGYVLASPTPWNLAVFIVVLAAQLRRIVAEEQMLAATEMYRAYMSVVRFRLIPRVF